MKIFTPLGYDQQHGSFSRYTDKFAWGAVVIIFVAMACALALLTAPFEFSVLIGTLLTWQVLPAIAAVRLLLVAANDLRLTNAASAFYMSTDTSKEEKTKVHAFLCNALPEKRFDYTWVWAPLAIHILLVGIGVQFASVMFSSSLTIFALVLSVVPLLPAPLFLLEKRARGILNTNNPTMANSPFVRKRSTAKKVALHQMADFACLVLHTKSQNPAQAATAQADVPEKAERTEPQLA